LRERRLAAARRSPEHHARRRAALDGATQRLARREQMLLSVELVERPWAHAMRERLPGVVVGGECEWLSFHWSMSVRVDMQ
jgi:hypothetical protein